jgi:predicted cation transporter
MVAGLVGILLLVLVLPFIFRAVEHNLEAFLFVMGVAATLVSRTLNPWLVLHALREPLMITTAVLLAGLLFKLLQRQVGAVVEAAVRRLSLPLLGAVVVAVLGLACSVITAIIASLVLVEIINSLPAGKNTKVPFAVVACFAIGLGAALTPVGEPLSTIATSKMGQGLWYLAGLLARYIIPGILVLAVLSAYLLRARGAEESDRRQEIQPETWAGVVVRALKVYLFVMALVLLGEGFRPVIDMYVLSLRPQVLYWINMVSAILDNATLTAAEITREMTDAQVRAILMGLLISGGMLIPGNIPNIISAGKLGIGSREWARTGVPLGLGLLAAYFVILFIL